MADQHVTVTLASSGGATSSANGTLHRFSALERGLRASGLLLMGLIGAAILIPIPLVHLLGIPLLLLLGVVLAFRQLSLAGRLKSVRLACPNCGAMNRVGGGLGMARPDAPKEINCDSCRRLLVLCLKPMPDDTEAPQH